MNQQWVTLFFIMAMILKGASAADIRDSVPVERKPIIVPDYSDIVIPPNIAPLNFMIRESGRTFTAVIASESKSFEVSSKSGIIRMPPAKWRKLIESGVGAAWTITLYTQDHHGAWFKYEPITNYVSEQAIDSHVVYRLINPAYVLWWEMGLYQRDLTTFTEKPIFTNRLTKKNCMNCHSFCLNDPQRMMFHLRAEFGGTMIIQENKVSKINTATGYTMSAGVYPAWHPDGNHIAFSVNKIYQQFHAAQPKSTFVYDTASDLVIYDIEKNQITTSPAVSTKRMENLPAWDPNGHDLYFISAAEFINDSKLDSIQYDLMHTTYNVNTNTWGTVTPLLTAKETGSSLSFPKVSPKGRFLMFTMNDYGYFGIYTPGSDLWLYDLQQKNYAKLAVNSNLSDSYHSWSSDGQWFVFASKRDDGLCSRLYFSCIDENGRASKPFLLPQKDPRFYDTFLLN
ncbi:MAG: hypothetical protein EHM72_19945, partial [Calditrichaeota bacterium]